MRRALLLVAVAGCASAASPPPDEALTRPAVIFSSKETGTLYGDKPLATSAVIAAPPATVWVAVKKVYADLDIPLRVENPASRQMGNPDFFKYRQMAGKSMTEFVDCGTGMTGPKAATYKIYMSLLTMVIPDGKGGTTVQTTFVSSGQDMTGASTDRIPCGTTGRFEQLFLDQVKATAGR